jgi:hypothetical protein
MQPRKTEYGKIFASFRYKKVQCFYDIAIPFTILATGEFNLPTGYYISTPDSRNAPNCGSPIHVNVANSEDETVISWG